MLFWIHGGGFSHGAGSQAAYDGGPLTERGDVVVVTINYRVGALGYLYLGDHGGDAWGAAANVGQLDQIAALQWVHDNIAAFGGDPDNVTIFGQSAGGVAVSTLLAMPAATGLFPKAILQSGTANRLGDTDAASAVTTQYLERLGIPDGDPDRLRAVEIAELLKAQGRRAPRPGRRRRLAAGASARGRARRPRGRHPADGRHRPGRAEAVRPLRTAPRSTTPNSSGRTRVSAAPRPDRVDEVVALYRSSALARGLPATNHDVFDAIATSSRFRFPAIQLAEAQAVHRAETYVYQVDWESPARRGGALGACHTIEIPFVFGTLGKTGNDRMSGTGPAADRLAEQMMDAWIAFARTGEPGHDGIGPWPTYDTTDRHTMIFGRERGARSAPFEEERAVWESMLSRH